MRHPLAVSAIGAVIVSFFSVCTKADPIDHKIAHLDHDIRALNASLITAMSQVETSIANDVELLHASVVAAQLESVDTAAAYREAKSLIADLDNLRQHAIADLTLPSDYTPPDVPAAALAGASTDPKSVLVSTYEHAAGYEHSFADLTAESLDIQKRLDVLLDQNRGPLLQHAIAWDRLAAELAGARLDFSHVTSGIMGFMSAMARNVR